MKQPLSTREIASKRHGFRPRLERLEDRRMLSATLIEDVNKLAVPGWVPEQVTVVGSTLFFVQTDGTHGKELWKSDGTTTGTAIVKDITVGSAGSNLTQFVDVGGILYFIVGNTNHAPELWRSDGTEAGTALVKRIGTSSDTLIRNLHSFGGGVIFSVSYQVAGTASTRQESELWKSDGTAPGTARFVDIDSGAGWANPAKFVEAGGKVYFVARNAAKQNAIWTTDGTAAGTSILKFASPNWLASSGNLVYFHLPKDDLPNASGLWVSDGTESGTVFLKELGLIPHTKDVNGTFYFVAHDQQGEQLWRSDGTPAGTIALTTFSSGPYAAPISYLVSAGNTVYFLYQGVADHVSVWRSDSTGTQQVADMFHENGGLLGFAAVDSTVYFVLWPNDLVAELWKTDGTTGMTLVREFA